MSKTWIPAVGYLRRSTEKQEASIRDQRKAIEKYAAEHGYKIVRWYIDDGISGDDTQKRLEFQRMWRDASSGEFQAVICWNQDRFGRFDSLEAGHWIYPFRQAKIQLVTVSEGVVDWNDFTGRVMYALKQEGKHQFLVDLSRDVTRGQLEAAIAGGWIGAAPYGYRIEGPKKNKRLVLAEDEKQVVVRRIFREFVDDGRSMTNIANRLTQERVPSPGENVRWRFDAVKVILENPAYTGDFIAGRWSYGKYHTIREGSVAKVAASDRTRFRKPESEWIVHRSHHPDIIDRPLFERAKAILARGKTGRSPHTPETNPYLLSGMLRCGKCGAPMCGLDSRKHLYYICGRHKYDGSEACEGTTVREDRVLDSVSDFLQREFSFPDGLREKAEKGLVQPSDLGKAFYKLRELLVPASPSQANDPKLIERQIKKLDGQLVAAKRNLAYVARKNIPEVEKEIRSMEEKRASFALELQQRPTEADVNRLVVSVSTKLAILQLALSLLKGKEYKEMGRKSQSLKRLLRDIEAIKIVTEKVGRGTRIRHNFIRGEIQLTPVGVVTGDLNPHLSA